jgi:hypothetical protein
MEGLRREAPSANASVLSTAKGLSERFRLRGRVTRFVRMGPVARLLTLLDADLVLAAPELATGRSDEQLQARRGRRASAACRGSFLLISYRGGGSARVFSAYLVAAAVATLPYESMRSGAKRQKCPHGEPRYSLIGDAGLSGVMRGGWFETPGIAMPLLQPAPVAEFQGLRGVVESYRATGRVFD